MGWTTTRGCGRWSIKRSPIEDPDRSVSIGAPQVIADRRTGSLLPPGRSAGDSLKNGARAHSPTPPDRSPESRASSHALAQSASLAPDSSSLASSQLPPSYVESLGHALGRPRDNQRSRTVVALGLGAPHGSLATHLRRLELALTSTPRRRPWSCSLRSPASPASGF